MKGTSSVRRLRLRSFRTRLVPPLCSATSGCSCVRSFMRFLNLWMQIALQWLHDLHECCMGKVLGRKPEHETLCYLVFFRVKWLQPAMKGTSSVRRLRRRSFRTRLVPPLCSATSGCSCVRSSMPFLKLWLQIALEWLHDLHECCMGKVLGRKPEHETLCYLVFFRVKWLQPAMKGTSSVRRLRLRSFRTRLVPPRVLQRVVVPVCVVLCV